MNSTPKTLEAKTVDLKSYPAPWDGELVLACKRCQKKLRKAKHPPAFARLRKCIKARLRKEKSSPTIHLIEIPCQKICPRNGIVVCSQSQLSARPPRFSIISTGAQMKRFCELFTAQKSNTTEATCARLAG